MTRLYYDRGDFERWSAQAQQLGYKVHKVAYSSRQVWLAELVDLSGALRGELVGYFSRSRPRWLDVDDPRVLQ